MIAEHGPIFNLRILWTNTIMTVSPECIKLILATDFDNYVKGSFCTSVIVSYEFTLSLAGNRFQTALMSVLGNGVFNSDGKHLLRFSDSRI